MILAELYQLVEAHKRRRRVGRGPGSGTGKTSSRGHGGAKSRSGFSHKYYMEGGQMPLSRRLPKRGFSNARFRVEMEVVNLDGLNRFEDGAVVDPDVLAQAGLVQKGPPVKILGRGELQKRLELKVHRISGTARKAVEDKGGSIEMIKTRRDKWEEIRLTRIREKREARRKRAAARKSGGADSS